MENLRSFVVVYIDIDNHVKTESLDKDLSSFSDEEIIENFVINHQKAIVLRPEDNFVSAKMKIDSLLGLDNIIHSGSTSIDEMHSLREDAFLIKSFSDFQANDVLISLDKKDNTFSGRKKTYRDFRSQFKI